MPWYGTLFNHSAIVIATALGAIAYEGLKLIEGGPLGPDATEFVAAVVAGVIALLANWTMSLIAVSDAHPRAGPYCVGSRCLPSRPIACRAGATRVAHGETFQLPNGVGWWATLLFVVPLFTTRLAYARYVETRELFEQTIGALAKAVDAVDPLHPEPLEPGEPHAEAMSGVMRLPESEIEKIKGRGCCTTSARSASATTSSSRRVRSTSASGSS